MPRNSLFGAALWAAWISVMWPASVWAEEVPLPSGVHEIQLNGAGTARSYQVFVPEKTGGQKPSPMLIVLHGTGSNGTQMLALGGFQDHAAEQGYILVAPNSLGLAFNEGSGRGGPDVKGVDDVAFIEAVADHIRARANIDGDRMFLAGFSSGGAMAQRMALQSDYPWAAITAVAGHLWVPAEGAKRPTDLLLVWGMADPLNPKDGGPVEYARSGVTLDKPSPSATHLKWADLLECYEGEFTESAPFQNTQKLSIDTCYEGKRLDAYFIDGFGHHWPGAGALPLPPEVVGPYTETFQLTKVMWEFFEGY